MKKYQKKFSKFSAETKSLNDVKNAKMDFITRKSQIMLLFTFLAGCTTVQPGHGCNLIGFTESGQASYYADKHQNRKTASGELYKHSLKTAAHKKLPFGTKVKVTNINNGKSVMVKINDRGPFVKDRIIDLSKSAFDSISNTSSGLIEVNIEVIAAPATANG